MRVFVCFDGDHIGREVGRAVMTDDVAAVRRVDQAINAGNDLWRSLALRAGGTVIEIGGDEGRIELDATHLSEIPAVARQYAEAVGATVSVGVGMKLSESAKALLVAKLRHGNQIVLWHPDMQAELDAATPKNESEKIGEAYLGKTSPERPPGHTIPTKPSVMHGQGDHEEGAVIKDLIADADEQAPPEPEKTHAADDLEEQLHSAAGDQEQKDQAAAKQSSDQKDQVRAQLAQVLGLVREKAPVIGQLQQVDPEAYQAIMALVQGVIALGREVTSNEPAPDPGSEPQHVQDGLDAVKATDGPANEMSGSPATQVGGVTAKSGGPIPGSPANVHLNLPIGSQVNGKTKVRHGDGTESWVEMRSGAVAGQEADAPLYGENTHPVSSRQPGAR